MEKWARRVSFVVATLLLFSASNGRDHPFTQQQLPASKPILAPQMIPRDMKKPIYIYYQLDKFYQNHRRYAKSRSYMQLRDPKEANATAQFCKPEATAANGSPIVPCGLIAWSLFNDTYSFAHRRGGGGDQEPLRVIKGGISWRSEREHMFGNRVYPKNFRNGSLVGGGQLDPSKPLSEQEDLIVWMRMAALPTFRKLYGRLEVDLRAGELITVTTWNNYNSYNFGGKNGGPNGGGNTTGGFGGSGAYSGGLGAYTGGSGAYSGGPGTYDSGSGMYSGGPGNGEISGGLGATSGGPGNG